MSYLDVHDVVPESTLIGKESHPLTELDITKCSNQGVDALSSIALAFKNLNILRFDATDATIRIICANLPQLEGLYIAGDNVEKLSDYGICGIPLKYCKELNANQESFLLFDPENQDPYNISRLQSNVL